jgi:hypothetical protein
MPRHVSRGVLPLFVLTAELQTTKADRKGEINIFYYCYVL